MPSDQKKNLKSKGNAGQNRYKYKDKTSTRVTSINRKLHRQNAAWRLGSAFWVMIGMILLTFIAYVVFQELAAFKEISFNNIRSFKWENEIGKLFYCVSAPDGEEMVKAEVFPLGMVVIVPAVLLWLLRMINIVLSWHKDNRKIRRVLSPINELALKAEELSRIGFSEEKYHMLEDAITHIDPEQMQTLSLGDSDLAGVETAMNNLLLRMRESYMQQARFVNDASHELRTPIAIIEGYANMLDRWGMEDEKVLRESITAVKNESAHMKHLVEQLLFLARGDSGRTTLQFENTSLCGLMQEVYEESLMIDESHPYRYNRPETDIKANVDPGMLKQAVRILVDNAAKYTKEHDEIVLSVGVVSSTGKDVKPQGVSGAGIPDGDTNQQGMSGAGITGRNTKQQGVSGAGNTGKNPKYQSISGEGMHPQHPYLQVQDTGIGMEEADIDHMFERFYRSDEVRKYKGTGLGLSISKWIVDKHKGYFEVTSRQGLGTRIRIVLP